MNIHNRRNFLKRSFLSALVMADLGAIACTKSMGNSNKTPAPERPEKPTPFFKTRGLVLSWPDIATLDWPYLAHKAGLNMLSFHASDSIMESEAFRRFAASCKSFNIDVEYEQHAMYALLPRDLYQKDPSMFRMDEHGNRVNDFNCCPSSSAALEIIQENAKIRSAKQVPTTGRFYYWLDDGGKRCLCPKCKGFSFSDQALLIENEIVKTLKTLNESYTLSHLAYTDTIPAPTTVTPEPGIFLEYAPFQRRWDTPLSDRGARREGQDITHGEYLDHLDENLEIFPIETAQVLEYWLDVSLFSGWKKPAVQLPWNPAVCAADVETYAKKGIKHITSFGAYIDKEYESNHKDLSFIDEYGKILNTYTAG